MCLLSKICSSFVKKHAVGEHTEGVVGLGRLISVYTDISFIIESDNELSIEL